MTDRVATGVAPEFLDKLAFHPRSAKVGCEPVPTAMRRKALLRIMGVWIVEADRSGMLGNGHADSLAFESVAEEVREQRVCLGGFLLAHPYPALQDTVTLAIEEHHRIGAI